MSAFFLGLGLFVTLITQCSLCPGTRSCTLLDTILNVKSKYAFNFYQYLLVQKLLALSFEKQLTRFNVFCYFSKPHAHIQMHIFFFKKWSYTVLGKSGQIWTLRFEWRQPLSSAVSRSEVMSHSKLFLTYFLTFFRAFFRLFFTFFSFFHFFFSQIDILGRFSYAPVRFYARSAPAPHTASPRW